MEILQTQHPYMGVDFFQKLEHDFFYFERYRILFSAIEKIYISLAILQFHTCHLIFTHETPLLHSIHDIIHGKGGNMN